MSIKITFDNVPGARYRYSPNGQATSRRFHVEGLDPTQADNVGRALTAVDATTGQGIPAYMQAHPTIPNLYVSEYDCWPAGSHESPSKTAVWVDVLYQSPQFFAGQNITMVHIGGANMTNTFNRWPTGAAKGQPIPVIVQFDPSTKNLSPDADFRNITNVADFLSGNPAQQGIYAQLCDTFQRLDGGTVIEFTRTETKPPDNSFRKTTNLRKWQGQAPGTWLCRDVVADQVFAGLGSTIDGYRITYTFESATPDQIELAAQLGKDDMTGQQYGAWTQVAYYHDSFSGLAIPAVSLTSKKNGWQACDPYPRKDFAALKLPTIYT